MKKPENFRSDLSFLQDYGTEWTHSSNSIMRPAIELCTGIKIGPARGPLAPATDDEMKRRRVCLRKAGKSEK